MTINQSEVSDGYHTFNELYQHRNLLCLAFLYERPSGGWRSRLHNDGSSFDGWFIVGTELQLDNEAVQITYHFPVDLWESCYFLKTLDKAPVWDGHTPQDVVDRLQKFLRRHAEKAESLEMIERSHDDNDTDECYQDVELKRSPSTSKQIKTRKKWFIEKYGLKSYTNLVNCFSAIALDRIKSFLKNKTRN